MSSRFGLCIVRGVKSKNTALSKDNSGQEQWFITGGVDNNDCSKEKKRDEKQKHEMK